MQRHFGQSLVEVIVALGIVLTIVAAFVQLSLGSFELNRHGRDDTIAAYYAAEGLEASRFIARRDFDQITVGVHGLDASAGIYAFTGSSNAFGSFTRVVSVDAVRRDGNGDIVASGGSDDPDTRAITSAVTWNLSEGGTRQVSLLTYLTHWERGQWLSDLFSTFENFYRNSTSVTAVQDGEVELLAAASLEDPTTFFNIDLPGTAHVNEVATDPIRDRLYIALDNQSGTTPEFLTYDISNISDGQATQSGAIDLEDSSEGFAAGRDYAYVLTNGNVSEIVVVRLRDFQIVAVWDLPGSSDPLDIVIDEAANRAYVGRSAQSGDEFYVLNIANPEGNLSVVNDIEIGASVNGIAIWGAYGYLVTGHNSQELITVHLDAAVHETCNLSGNEDATEIQIAGDRLFIGRSGGAQAEFAEYRIDGDEPGDCEGLLEGLVGSAQLDAFGVLDMAVQTQEGYAVFTVDDGDNELRIVKLSTFGLVESRGLPGNTCDAVTYDGAYIYAGCRDGTSTLQILEGTANRAFRGSITSFPFDSGAEGTVWDDVSWTVSGIGSVSVRIRTANSLQNLKQAVWVGPDGTTATAYATSAGQPIVTDPQATGTRYMQWKAILTGQGTTPILEHLTITYP
ncbi:hypothetical protein HYZ99_04175 [Candidatus Peregrinibacteria bacterium]|nr:hypothetical protein [Candidatus Peregrinibacteria bacterium]